MSIGIDVTTTDGLVDVCLLRRSDGHWLDAAQRAQLLAALGSVGRGVVAIVLRSADRSLASHPDGGPDLPGGDDTAAPTLASLCLAIEASPVPVVMLLEGPVAGASAEMALAARARVATPGARIAFPAARLGRISGAGGTQRLPRLIGAEQSLRLLTAGKAVAAPEALAIGLVDQVVEGETPVEVLDAARAWAKTHAALPRSTAAFADGRAYLAAVKAIRAEAAPGSLAMALADCTEAALLLPPEQGFAFEAMLAAERDALPQTSALAHLIRAERAAAVTPEPLRAVKVAQVARPALVGASPQLAALSLMALARGVRVTLLEPERARLVPMLQSIASRQEAAVQAGALSAAQRDADWARLRPVVDAAELVQCDLVIVAADTAVPSLPASVPLLVMGRTDLPPAAFRLVLSGRVAELGLPANCPAAAAAQALAFLRRIGQMVVLTGVQSPVGISGRLAGAGGAALRALIASGVAPDAIVSALTNFGLAAPMVPKAEPGPMLRLMSADEIVSRWLAALANEGARLLSAGLALSPHDVDLVAIHGLGLPAESGGPLYQAEQRGLMILRRDLRLWAEEAEVWKPVPALDALVSTGRGFRSRVSRG
ncbi:MAG: enoyl-CoA hydratase-related protein [Pseudotabrizicola sp.]|uniref:enoyl-CoA hydratase-related protein n=1 Tax=Pseudotabrizicola sp. TaxID=2939647 RepID=UPI00272CE8F6|nr:enoyl-CoA hydratase-related protein [Pseudotabrizicola sp.]MDP2081536.1 enoyl-CoA hydratase-related protein [Pseudotabrizicola sp.]MDZ7575739.1 enoyl-CoA hydratase-related protein [Pseudotabrizicola sp.]